MCSRSRSAVACGSTEKHLKVISPLPQERKTKKKDVWDTVAGGSDKDAPGPDGDRPVLRCPPVPCLLSTKTPCGVQMREVRSGAVVVQQVLWDPADWVTDRAGDPDTELPMRRECGVKGTPSQTVSKCNWLNSQMSFIKRNRAIYSAKVVPKKSTVIILKQRKLVRQEMRGLVWTVTLTPLRETWH